MKSRSSARYVVTRILAPLVPTAAQLLNEASFSEATMEAHRRYNCQAKPVLYLLAEKHSLHSYRWVSDRSWYYSGEEIANFTLEDAVAWVAKLDGEVEGDELAIAEADR